MRSADGPSVAHNCPADGSMHENSADCPCRPERVSESEWRHRSDLEQIGHAAGLAATGLRKLIEALTAIPREVVTRA